MGAPCREVNSTQPTKYIIYMNIETTRPMQCLWTDYFQDDSRKSVAVIIEDKSVAQQMAKKLLHKSRDVATVS